MASSKSGSTAAKAPNIDPTRSVGVQTMYRDSEAQTDPYTPDFILKNRDERPEVLSIAHLTYNNGLPASVEEIKKVENRRERKRFDMSLPPMTDEVSFLLRRKMMEAQEKKEWDRREMHFENENRRRLDLIRSALIQREKTRSLRETARVDLLKEKKMGEKNRFANYVHQRRITNVRKTMTAREDAQHKMFHPRNSRDVIDDYTNYASSVYAPIKRDGLAQSSSRGVAAVVLDDSSSAKSLRILADLEDSLPSSLTSMKIPSPRLHKHLPPINTEQRKARIIQTHLDRTAKLLEDEISGKSKDKKESNLLSSVSSSSASPPVAVHTPKKKKILRPPTPEVTLDEANESEQKVRAAICLIQRLLRGRAVQNMMYEARERQRNLIRELRYDEGDENLRDNENDKEHSDWQRSEVIESTRDKMVGEVLASTLATLARGDMTDTSSKREGL